MNVSPAVSRDIEDIVRAVLEFAKSGYPDDTCDEDHIWSVVKSTMDSRDALVAVLRDEGEFSGVFMGSMGANLLTGRLICAEIFFWVEPRYRGHGKRLLTYAQRWALENGCVSFVLSAPKGAERASMVFERWGFVPTECWYRKAL